MAKCHSHLFMSAVYSKRDALTAAGMRTSCPDRLAVYSSFQNFFPGICALHQRKEAFCLKMNNFSNLSNLQNDSSGGTYLPMCIYLRSRNFFVKFGRIWTLVVYPRVTFLSVSLELAAQIATPKTLTSCGDHISMFNFYVSESALPMSLFLMELKLGDSCEKPQTKDDSFLLCFLRTARRHLCNRRTLCLFQKRFVASWADIALSHLVQSRNFASQESFHALIRSARALIKRRFAN